MHGFTIDVPAAIDFQKFLNNINNLGPSDLKTGFDPEVFVRNRTTGDLIPGFELLPGPKPSPDSALGPSCVYPDGFAVEFATEPKGCLAYATDHIQAGLRLAARAAERVDGGLDLADVAHIPNITTYGARQVQLGCSPSHNAYGKESQIPEDPYALPFRTIGCHVHFGRNPNVANLRANLLAPQTIEQTVRTLDYVVGPIMTSLLAGLEDPLRRTIYGRAGEFRFKPYGFEYRVPSAAIMWHPVLFNIIVNTARNVTLLAQLPASNIQAYYEYETRETMLKSVKSGATGIHIPDDTYDFVDAVVNRLDVDAARAHLKSHKDLYLGLFQSIIAIYDEEWCSPSDTIEIYGSVRALRPRASDIFDFVMAGASRVLDTSHKGILDAWRIHPDQVQMYPSSGITAATWKNYMSHARWPGAQVAYGTDIYKAAVAARAAAERV